MSASNPLVYFILGTPGSGRRAVVRDLVQNGLAEGEKALLLLAEGEGPADADAAIAKLSHATVRPWHWQQEGGIPEVDVAGFSTVFLFADPLISPMDQLEALKPWLQSQHLELARVFCVVDCQLAEKQPALRQWFDACIHFSDVVFLSRRDGVDNKWLSDFIAHFKDQCFPCHFVHVKKGDFSNPAMLLDPTPRRVSQYFEEGEVYVIEGLETDDEEDEDDDSSLLKEEPYFVRQRSGRREKEVPDLKAYLGK